MDQLYVGLFLMVVGMGTVFLFLALLIISTGLIHKFAGTPDAPTPPAGGAGADPDTAALTAVLTAAITHHRKVRGQSPTHR